jgi:hypothetical protein
MTLTRWISNLTDPSTRPIRRRRARAARPALDALEGRLVLSTLTVTSIADSGAGSLRAEIAVAHNGDTVVFDKTVFKNPQTITLTGGELLLKKDLTISGPGAGQLTISGSKASRVFQIAKGYSDTLSALTISSGSATGTGTAGDGGAIDNFGTLTVSGCTLSNNTAVGGGAICNELTGNLTVENNCVLTGNYASNSGGGINNDGTVTISNTTLSNNSTGYGGAGGAIMSGGTMTITSSILSSNSATIGGSGGGIENSGKLTVASSALFSNTAGMGGGIDSGGTLTVNGGSLLNNHAGTGGGISGQGTVSISGCTLAGNSASWGTSTGPGGGIFFQDGALTVSNCTLTGNSAFEGGAIYVNGGSTTATFTYDTIGSNTATGYGGGIYIVAAATVSLDSFTVANTINNTDSSGLNGPTANIDGSYTQR